MSVWYVARGAAHRAGWRGRVVLIAGVLAVALVAVVPVALLVGVLLMLFGHVLVGLAVCGASVLAAVAAVAVAGASGVRYLRGLMRRGLGDLRLSDQGPHGQDWGGQDTSVQRGHKVVRLPAEDYGDTWSD